MCKTNKSSHELRNSNYSTTKTKYKDVQSSTVKHKDKLLRYLGQYLWNKLKRIPRK